MVDSMISGLVFVVVACAGVLACVLIAWAARGTKAEEGRKWVAGLPDLLLYASMIDDGILLLQDGALMATWRYAGPDLGSATHEEMAALAERLNSVLKLGSGWLVHCDAIRCEVNEYAKQGAFPDSVTSLIDDERRAQFKAEGRHYESIYYISLTYLPPMQSEEKVKGYLFENNRDIKFYDYTKSERRYQDFLDNRLPKNYHLTLSSHENMALETIDEYITHGGKVTVVFSTPKSKELPKKWKGHKVYDGDTSDLRFLDPKGFIIGLKAKGKARKDTTGFVVQV